MSTRDGIWDQPVDKCHDSIMEPEHLYSATCEFHIFKCTMSNQEYTSIPDSENEKDSGSVYRPRKSFTTDPTSMCISICLIALVLIAFTTGMKVGQTWESYHHDHVRDRGDGLLDPQTFIGSSKFI